MENGLYFGLLLAVLAAPTVTQADSFSRSSLREGIFIADSDEAPEGEVICIPGRLTDEGIECPALRSENQSLYTLAGDTDGFEVGDEVCVCGSVAEVSFCMQGTTIAVTHISSGKQGCPPQAP